MVIYRYLYTTRNNNKLMKRNSIMEESRKLITPEIKQSVDFSIDIADRIFDHYVNDCNFLDILEKKTFRVTTFPTCHFQNTRDDNPQVILSKSCLLKKD